MANLCNHEPQALIDWRSIEENQKVFQKLSEDLDDLLVSLRSRMKESAGDEDDKASAPRCQEDQVCLGPEKKPQSLPKWSSGRSPGNPAQKRCETEKEDRKPDEKDLQRRCEDNDGVQQVQYGQRSVSEIKDDQESSQFLLRWPPEGSVRSGGAEPHHS